MGYHSIGRRSKPVRVNLYNWMLIMKVPDNIIKENSDHFLPSATHEKRKISRIKYILKKTNILWKKTR